MPQAGSDVLIPQVRSASGFAKGPYKWLDASDDSEASNSDPFVHSTHVYGGRGTHTQSAAEDLYLDTGSVAATIR